MADATGEQPVHKVGVGAAGDLPGQLDAGVPSIKHLVCLVTSKLPKIPSIKVTSKDLDSTHNLHWAGKEQGYSDI